MKRSLFLLHLPLATLLFLTACGEGKRGPAPSAETVADLRLETVAERRVPDTFEAVGTVRSIMTAQVSSQIMASVVEIKAREGESVKRGQVLIVLDDREVAARRRQASAGLHGAQQGLAEAEQDLVAAEANRKAAEATFQRYQTLVEKRSVSRQEFDDIEAHYKAAAAARQAADARRAQALARIDQARAEMAAAETSYGYSRLRAPVDGILAERKIDAGSLATPGMPLLIVEDTRRYRLESTIEEGRKSAVRLKQPVRVSLDALGQEPLAGTVEEIVPEVDPATRTFLVKIGLPSRSGLRSGLFGRAEFTVGERAAFTVPATALFERGQLEAIYVVASDGTIQLRFVTVGKRLADGRVEVLSGLGTGDRVVTNPAGRRLDGKRVP